MITEKEAVAKICCVTDCGAPSPELSPSMIRHKGELLQRYCIGSKCMGWRWCEPMIDGPDSYQSEPGPKGYCGRAGMPE